MVFPSIKGVVSLAPSVSRVVFRSHERVWPEDAVGLFPKSLTQQSRILGAGPWAEEGRLNQEVSGVPLALNLVGVGSQLC